MSDNTELSSGSGGDSIRTIDKSGKKTQVITLDLGGAGAEALVAGTVPVSGTVTASGPVTDAQLRAVAVPVSLASLPLPSGAATDAVLTAIGNVLASIDGKTTAVNTGAVVVSSSALPSGASTGAKQDTGNVSVASIDTKTPALGQALAAASVPVVLTAAQLTTLTPPAAIVGFALEAGHLATIDVSTAKIPAQGQALAAASLPVVLTAIQQAVLTPPAAIVGFAIEAGNLATIAAKDFATSAKQDTGNASLVSLDAKTGTLEGKPAAYSELDRLYQICLKLDKIAQTVATEATLMKLAAPLVVKRNPTLLHRS